MADLGPRVPKRLKVRSRELRKEAPVPERVLWGLLRDRRIGGVKFRRQHVIGPYVANFYCADARLVVGLDGMSHMDRGEADDARDACMRGLGYTVLRVTNDDLLQHEEAVITAIARAAGVDW